MKHGFVRAKVACAMALLIVVCLSSDQSAGMSGGSYTLDWTDVPGGGSTVTGGTYSLGSSAGQPDAGVMAGGTFTLKGGFWTFRMPLLGDINDDGYVNVGDLQLLVAAWGSQKTPPSSNWNANADLNNDGFVNVGDLQLLVQNWGQSAN